MYSNSDEIDNRLTVFKQEHLQFYLELNFAESTANVAAKCWDELIFNSSQSFSIWSQLI